MFNCMICNKINDSIMIFSCQHQCCLDCLLNLRTLNCKICNIDISKNIPLKIQNIMYNLEKQSNYGPYCCVKPGEYHECDCSCFP